MSPESFKMKYTIERKACHLNGDGPWESTGVTINGKAKLSAWFEEFESKNRIDWRAGFYLRTIRTSTEPAFEYRAVCVKTGKAL